MDAISLLRTDLYRATQRKQPEALSACLQPKLCLVWCRCLGSLNYPITAIYLCSTYRWINITSIETPQKKIEQEDNGEKPVIISALSEGGRSFWLQGLTRANAWCWGHGSP